MAEEKNMDYQIVHLILDMYGVVKVYPDFSYTILKRGTYKSCEEKLKRLNGTIK